MAAGWLRALFLLSTQLECLRTLIVAPAPTAAQAKTYSLHDAAAAGDASAVELLLHAGVPSEARNARSSTPLHLAAVKGHDDVAQVLLAHGANPNAANSGGNTPLHAAVETGQAGLAGLLVAHGADAYAPSHEGFQPLKMALGQGQLAILSSMLQAGAVLDAETVQATFWTAAQMAEEAAGLGELPPQVPELLHHVFDADFDHLQRRPRSTHNVTCKQPTVDAPKTRAEEEPGYNVINDELLAVPLREGRACVGGRCCEACSRVTFESLCTVEEVDAFVQELEVVWPDDTGHQFSISKCAFRDMRTSLVFVRLVERMRRVIAHEYGLPLSTVTPLQTFVSRFEGQGAKQGGLHSDESTFKEFHYSCVLYLSTQGDDFEGGTFSWSDPSTVGGEPRLSTPLAPSKGAAVIFSSGWENMHEVEPLASGKRFAVPSFFTTLPEGPPPEATVANDARLIADELWRSLLNPQSAEDTRQFILKWHSLMAPHHS